MSDVIDGPTSLADRIVEALRDSDWTIEEIIHPSEDGMIIGAAKAGKPPLSITVTRTP